MSKCLRCGLFADRYAQCCNKCMAEYMELQDKQVIAAAHCTVDGRVHETKPVAADQQPVDPQVVLGLLPADAVFIVRRGYVAGGRDTSKLPHGYYPEYLGSNRARLRHDGADIGVWFYSDEAAIAAAWEHVQEFGDDASEDDGVRVDPLLWRPKSSGYVSEYNPWQAGLYTQADKDYRPRGEDPDAHSYTVSVQGYLVGAIPDGTPLAVLVDEIVRLRAEQEFARVLATLAINGHLCGGSTPTPWTVERCDEFSGPNTAHVWQLWDANESCIEYLSASVDGPAFVAWVNRTATLSISEVVQ